MELWDKIEIRSDPQGLVEKYIFTKDDAVAESVLYKYPTYEERTVICCSTQSGCPVGCRFCGTGEFFVRSLSVEEIVSQPTRLLTDTGIAVADIKRLQIMFMSMGEPMLNWKNLKEALHTLYRKYPSARLLISTIGPTRNNDFFDLSCLSIDIPTIGLQFSIHESTNKARNKLIPFKAKYSLEEIAQKGKEWRTSCGRNPYFNYCVHDKNNSPEDADRLLALFDPKIWCATISVICEQTEWLSASNDHQRNLAIDFSGLIVERGYNTRVFDPAGQDTIGGGCGMLWFVQDWAKKNPNKVKASCGAGRPKIHTPTFSCKN